MTATAVRNEVITAKRLEKVAGDEISDKLAQSEIDCSEMRMTATAAKNDLVTAKRLEKVAGG
jgi:hypothetical protein